MLLMFGILHTMISIDYEKIYLNSRYDNNDYFFGITKKTDSLSYYDIDTIKNELGEDRLFYTYNLFNDETLGFLLGEVPNSIFYETLSASGFMELNEETCEILNFEILDGTLPSNDDEIVISQYFFEYFKASGYRDILTNDVISIQDYSDLIGKKIGSWQSIIDGEGYTICGIIDTNFDEDKYEELKFINKNAGHPHNLDLAYFNLIENYSAHTLLFVCDGYFSRNQHDAIPSVVTALTGLINQDEHLIRIFNPKSEIYEHCDDLSIDLFLTKETLNNVKGLLIISLIAFIVIASILMLNYYSVVYIDEERTIKIFQAMGIRWENLFLIVLTIPLTLSIINIFISSVASKYLTIFINQKIQSNFFYEFSLLSFGFIQVFSIAFISIIITFIAVLIPLKKHTLIK